MTHGKEGGKGKEKIAWEKKNLWAAKNGQVFRRVHNLFVGIFSSS